MMVALASLLLHAAPTPLPSQRLNLEPVLVGVAGGLSLGVAAWQWALSNETYRQLLAIAPVASSAVEAKAVLSRAATLTTRGKEQTSAAGGFMLAGAALVVTGVVWLFVEGFTTRGWWFVAGPELTSATFGLALP
jgi:hypothetical protein